MSRKEEILCRLFGDGNAAPLYLPDLTLWYDWQQDRGAKDWRANTWRAGGKGRRWRQGNLC